MKSSNISTSIYTILTQRKNLEDMYATMPLEETNSDFIEIDASAEVVETNDKVTEEATFTEVLAKLSQQISSENYVKEQNEPSIEIPSPQSISYP